MGLLTAAEDIVKKTPYIRYVVDMAIELLQECCIIAQQGVNEYDEPLYFVNSLYR
jgi:hypothetical protein